jgi:membrane protease YdiL (CAAX protease family)
MALKFLCRGCYEVIVVKFLKIGEQYKCPNCQAVGIVPDSAEEIEAESTALTSVFKKEPVREYVPVLLPAGPEYTHEHTFSFALNNQHGVFPSVVPFRHINFIRAFRIIAITIVISQLIHLILTFSYIGEADNLPVDYFWLSGIVSIIIYIIFIEIITFDIKRSGFRVAELYRICYETLEQYLPTVIRYFLFCAAFVLFFTAFSPESELMLANKTPSLQLLTFFAVVIVAPVCEEMIFRGYFYTAMLHKFKRPKQRMALNAMLFAAVHVFFIELLATGMIPYYIFVVGYLLAKLYEDSRSILPGIVLHALNNGLVFGLEYFGMNGFILDSI